MKLVIIESPFAGDIKRHKAYLKKCMLDSLNRGECPFASHLLYTQVLDDTLPPQRKMGMKCGFEIMSRSDCTVVYIDYGISKGMKQGIKRAKKLGHNIEYRRLKS